MPGPPADIPAYNAALPETQAAICALLADSIAANLKGAAGKIWHGHPVWFLDGNPIVGYSAQKAGLRLMFWSGASFDEPKLAAGTGKFRDASITYAAPAQVKKTELKRWLRKAAAIQWDYKNIVKRKGKLERLK